jgi:hypothetical protein
MGTFNNEAPNRREIQLGESQESDAVKVETLLSHLCDSGLPELLSLCSVASRMSRFRLLGGYLLWAVF